MSTTVDAAQSGLVLHSIMGGARWGTDRFGS